MLRGAGSNAEGHFAVSGAGLLKHARVFLKAQELIIAIPKLSSLHREILHVTQTSAHLEENCRIKTDLEGCQREGGGGRTMHLA